MYPAQTFNPVTVRFMAQWLISRAISFVRTDASPTAQAALTDAAQAAPSNVAGYVPDTATRALTLARQYTEHFKCITESDLERLHLALQAVGGTPTFR